MSGDDVLLEWSVTGQAPEEGEGTPDVTLFSDGRVRIGGRLAGGDVVWRQLTAEELETLRERVFGELRLLEIDPEALAREVEEAAAARRTAARTEAVEAYTGAQMDAGTTLLRAADGERIHEIRYHDLFGDAQAYPGVEALQRLRRVEMRMVELAAAMARRQG